MIDLLTIKIPFVESVVAMSPDGTNGLIDLRECQKRGCRLAAGDVDFTANDYRLDSENICVAEVSALLHPFESLPSSWSTLAFKIRAGGENYYPFIELKASPAKLLQGHNVYGSCDVMLCIDSLITAFCYAMPDMAEILEFNNAELAQIDCTFSAHLKTESDSRNVIHALRNISNGQTRGAKSAFDTTAYFGKGSRHKRLKAYLKQFELQDQINKAQAKYDKTKSQAFKNQLKAMTAPEVQEFAKNALRLEASIMPRMLKRLGIPTNLWAFETYSESFEGCLIQQLWKQSWQDIFKTFEGATMRTYSDIEIHENLREQFKTETKNGFSYSKADRLFRTFRMMKHEGWDEVKSTTPKATFYRTIEELTQVVPKAYLQNLQATASNVVPLIRFVNVDFEQQHPSNWVEPQRLSEQLELPENRELLRLVS
ncbi:MULTISPECIES: phage/plasmid replication protein, II/X family [unclassified Pseudoalteromonas]|uniref:phage/plasmid replication protein, II/X family n=1 Tax=unclassified Pseudoalteromonas TaxID=194690 RepID=UPI0025B4F222|nr:MULTISPECIES: phage/plasmid replication protein, II/X family [unclassified Pseudoalteromonas]MDN3380974.1 phage/plasmid replication protein, II/X family [Pseudoalteromonas sp. APC 3893]MDN3389397.1 phage/plasmid replication protein, II/X family [Pseudoalteromonas sp. APC 4017]